MYSGFIFSTIFHTDKPTLQTTQKRKPHAMPSNELNAKQQCFVSEYLCDLNATQAAMRAGYSVKTAEQIGHQLLNKTSVKRAIGTALSERATKTERKAADVLADIQGLAQEAKSNYLKDPSNTAMLNGALKALELEGKHLGVAEHVGVGGGITSIVRTIVDPPIDFVNMNPEQIKTFVDALSD